MIKRRCVNPFFVVLEECSPKDELGSFGGSCCDFCGGSCGLSVLAPAVSSSGLEVTGVLVFPWSVGVLGEVSLSGSDCEFVESQSFSLQRASSCSY